MTDFASMSGVDLLEYCGADASKWAAAFCQIMGKNRWRAQDIDEGLMIGWFANAIERSEQVRHPAPAALAARPTDAQLASACMFYRHDFGLLDVTAKKNMMWQAHEWLRAWQKEFESSDGASGCPRECGEADDSAGSGIDRNCDDTMQGSRPAAAVKVPSSETQRSTTPAPNLHQINGPFASPVTSPAGGEMVASDADDFVAQLTARARFLRGQREVKSPELLEKAARIIAATPPAPAPDAVRGKLPLSYIDGLDYCTVKDATGADFALTVQPKLMQAMEAALSRPAEGADVPGNQRDSGVTC